uniref:Cytochrome c oxidase subunit 2 n=1 Tax=Montfortula punctata TaxID=1906930 RepID=A0A1J0CYH8_9VEST|nr:cytochrome c oxidase subunit II [Montfortula punctata]
MMAQWGQLSFCDPASPLMEKLVYFHDYSMMILIMILSLVGYVTVLFSVSSYSDRYTLDSNYLEVIWTIFPAVVLVFLVFPSLHLLYLLDEAPDCSLTIKAVGGQWYWSYEYADFKGMSYDSYMTPTDSLDFGDYRLLDADFRLILPVSSQVSVLVTSGDVIHSWTVPSLGVKADAVPGRLNQVSFFTLLPGVYYGQCSEICGANHSFMPIVVEVVGVDDFFSWVENVSGLLL